MTPNAKIYENILYSVSKDITLVPKIFMLFPINLIKLRKKFHLGQL